jgi:hypothetical protein
MGEQWWGTYVPHTPCPLHISLALRQQDDRLGKFVRGHRGEATHSCCLAGCLLPASVLLPEGATRDTRALLVYEYSK